MLFCRPKKKTKKEKKENRHRTISCGVRFCWAPEMPRSYFLLAFFLLLLLLLCFCVSVVSLCALLLFRSCLCRCSFPSSPTASPIASPIASPSASPFAPPPFSSFIAKQLPLYFGNGFSKDWFVGGAEAKPQKTVSLAAFVARDLACFAFFFFFFEPFLLF